MLKKYLLPIIILVASTFLFSQSPPDPGQGPDPDGPGTLGGPGGAMHWLLPGKWWKHPKASTELNLSPEQINKLDDIFTKHKSSMIDIKATIEHKELELGNLIDKDNADDNAILKVADNLIAAKGELQKTMIRMVLDMKKVLTPDQVKKLKAFRDELRTKRGEERGFMHGRRQERPSHPPSEAPQQPTPPPQP